MAVEASKLSIVVEADTRQAESALTRVEQKVRQTAASISRINASVSGGGGGGLLGGGGGGGSIFDSIAGGLKLLPGLSILTSGLSAAGGYLKDGIKFGFDFNRTMEESNITFEVLLKSQAKAKGLMGDLVKMAEKSPFTLPGIIDATKLMVGFGFSVEEVKQRILGLSDVAAATGSPMEAIVRQLGQMRARGRVSAEDLNALAAHGLRAREYISEQLAAEDPKFAKLTEEQRLARVYELGEQGRLSGKGSEQAIMRGVLRDFGGLGERFATQTATGLESNIQDIAARLAGTASGPAFEQYKNVLRGTYSGLQRPEAMSMAQGAAQFSTTAFAGLKGAGKAIDDGLKAGFPAVASGVETAKGYVSGFLEGIGAKSPAKEFIPIGQFAAQGFKIGFVSEMGAAGGVMGLFQQGGRGKLGTDRRAENEALLEDPRVQALMDVIGKGEGTFDPKTGKRTYNKIFGGKRVGLGEEHPGIYVPFGNTTSSAAGFGQFLEKTWKGVDKVFGGELDFNSPRDQEVAVVELMRQRGMIGPLMQGDTATAIRRGGREWASLPGSPYGQPTQSMSGALSTFNARLGVHANGGEVSNANPMPVRVVTGAGIQPDADWREMRRWAEEGGAGLDLAGSMGGVARVGGLGGGTRAAGGLKAGMSGGGRQFTVGTMVDLFMETQVATEGAVQGLEGLRMAAVTLTPAVEAAAGTLEQTTPVLMAAKEKASKRDRAALTMGGISSDFQGNLQGALMNPFSKKSWANAGMGLLQDIQGRAAHDLSSQLTGMLFGTEKDGKMGGGLLSKLFGGLFGGGGKSGGGGAASGIGGFFKSLFGGFFASGGDVSPGRFFVAGEQGPELIWSGRGGASVTPNHAMRSERQREQRFIFVDSEREAQRHRSSRSENFVMAYRQNRHIINRMGR
jgi:muramidase (phage lysozyme)